jgi:hypothetical protein
MLLHVRPRLLSRFKRAVLVDLLIEPFGVRLVGGKDLATRRPYPNKGYSVACRKKGQTAIDGILLECPGFVAEFRWTAHWAIEDALVVKHQVRCKVVDQDFNAASDNMRLWYACSPKFGGWSDRFLERGAVPLFIEPLMEIEPESVSPKRVVDDTIEHGWIMARSQSFSLPTIEPERILSSCSHVDRLPTAAMAFHL